MNPAPQSGQARRAINLPNRRPNQPFSDGMLVGDTLYISGRLGLDPATWKMPQDPEQEARNILDGIRAVLHEAGMEMDDLVQVQIFYPEVSLFDRFNAVY